MSLENPKNTNEEILDDVQITDHERSSELGLDEPTYENVEFFTLEEKMLQILNGMRPSIENAKYDLIVGIDASGRIPTLVIDKVINYIYTKNKVPYHCETKFIAGSGQKYYSPSYESHQLNQFYNGDLEIDKVVDNPTINRLLKLITQWNPQKKVLIVDDFLSTGNSITPMILALEILKIKYDLLVISGPHHRPFSDWIAPGMGNYFTNKYGYDSLTHNTKLSGVNKKSGDKFSKPTGNLRRSSRTDVNILVDHIIKKFEQ